MWFAKYLTARPTPPWGAALKHYLSTIPGGTSALADTITSIQKRTHPACWRSFAEAWKKLSPQWTFEMAEWTPAEALRFPVEATSTLRVQSGRRLIDLVEWNATTSATTLVPLSAVTKRRFGAVKMISDAITALQDGTSDVPAPVLQLALTSTPTPPRVSSRRALHAHIQIAGVMLLSLTTAVARRFLEKKAGRRGPFSWKNTANQPRAICKLGKPPTDIWQRLHHRARTPRHKETYYKLLLNALPLGARVRGFNPIRMFCHHCPDELQTTRHFLFSCPLAQTIWREVRYLFSLPHAVSLQHAAFSWSPNALVLGRRFGFRLQAGHAVAIHALWLLHCQATYNNCPATTAGARALYRAHLQLYLETLWASTPSSRQDQLDKDWFPSLASAFSTPPFNLVYI